MERTGKHGFVIRGWQGLRWAIVLLSLPLVWWACTSHPLAQPTPAPEQQTNLYVSISPVRQLDLLFMIDNSPSMAPKQDKLKKQFPNLINALRDPTNNNSLPDLRVAIIDSDLGTNNAWTSGNCGPNAANGNNVLGDQGKFLMPSATGCGVTDSNALWLETGNGAANFNGLIQDVFGCLAGGLGTNGCGEEHQLQAFEFALAVSNINNDTKQHDFIRPGAFLALVFLTDEDDCSAFPNDGLFGDHRGELDNETASLRCSTRAYQCNGQNLSVPAPGYPTTQNFSAPEFTDCLPRTDYCSNDLSIPYDTSKPTSCNPLTDHHRIAQEIKNLKGGDEEKILVAGIFGYPLEDKSHESIKFALHPNTQQGATPPQVFDYWSFCYDPDHRPAAATTDPATGFDYNAWGWGSGPGIRESDFVDQFKNGQKFSICERDYSGPMTTIGSTIAAKLQNLCVSYKLYNTNPGGPLVPDCRVAFRYLQSDGTYKEDQASLPRCSDGATQGNVDTDCWQLTQDVSKCPGLALGQLVEVLRTAAEISAGPLPAGTEVGMQCRTCTDFVAPAGSPEAQACNY